MWAWGSPSALAQSRAGSADGREQPAERRNLRLEDLPPSVRLGARAISTIEQTRVVPRVVVVRTEADYLDAVSRWTPKLRFPVLIDDGSRHSREQIARFVRAFEPERVVLYEPEDGSPEFRGEPGELHDRLRNALADAWGVPPAPEDTELEPHQIAVQRERALIAAWKPLDVLAPGVVVTHPHDRAWPAALALAAARAQPLIVQTVDKPAHASLTRAEVDSFARAIERACERTGLSWDTLGDRLDAVTICLNIPPRVEVGGEDKFLALTDLVGRHPGDSDGSMRWGWSSQILGSASDAAYQAMSSLFLSPSRALLFDGYPNNEPWSAFDAAPAEALLDQAGIPTTRIDTPSQSLRVWKMMAARPLEADLIFVNTKGGRDRFSLEPGQARSGDVPLLNRPAVVHFIHSFSAAQVPNRRTIAGRWLERGAIAYMGSVHEPFLAAFLPPEKVAQRLMAFHPWAIAPRYDRAKPWKVALLGDALLTLAGLPERDPDARLALSPLTGMGELASRAIRQRRFPDAVAAMTIQGRDSDVVRLIGAMLRDRPGEVIPELAAEAFMPVTRAGSRSDQLGLFRRLSTEDQEDPELLDALWLIQSPALEDPKLAGPTAALLAQHLRPDQTDADAIEVARALHRYDVGIDPVNFLLSVETGSNREREAIREEIQRLTNSTRSAPGG